MGGHVPPGGQNEARGCLISAEAEGRPSNEGELVRVQGDKGREGLCVGPAPSEPQAWVPASHRSAAGPVCVRSPWLPARTLAVPPPPPGLTLLAGAWRPGLGQGDRSGGAPGPGKACVDNGNSDPGRSRVSPEVPVSPSGGASRPFELVPGPWHGETYSPLLLQDLILPTTVPSGP